ncbi:MAG TPA: 3'(2'),5'-bisphosphate nucleotidase CysQ [Acidimicrobiales bacterium]|nr:3'(2'),5'-bisphosphate nucleotidase CysQ [Acidimicrobiales bacterium]
MEVPEHRIARAVAEEAGDLLLELRKEFVGDPDALRAEGDRRSHHFIVGSLHERAPGDPVLSEEGVADAGRLASRRVWIVDPLDGTREFGELERDDWAVHVALVVDGTPLAGAVALPARRLTLSTQTPAPVRSALAGAPRLVVSRTRPPALASLLADELGGELVPMGSAGAKAMAVVLGEADVYAHSGGQYEWDSAAPVAVALAAGLHASRLDGSPLHYNEADPWLPDLLICRPELAHEVLAVVAAHS